MDKRLMMFCDKERVDSALERVLFVDPGLSGTGWAFFPVISTGGKGRKADTFALSGVLHASKNESWGNRAWSICAEFDGILHSVDPLDVVLEFPELFNGSASSQASAAKGDLFKLAFLIGGLAHVARVYTGNLPILVAPKEWKGQLPKDVVIERIQKLLGADLKIKDHEGDAIGMGLAAQGRL